MSLKPIIRIVLIATLIGLALYAGAVVALGQPNPAEWSTRSQAGSVVTGIVLGLCMLCFRPEVADQ